VIIRMGLSHVKSVAKSIIGLLFVQELTLQGYGKSHYQYFINHKYLLSRTGEPRLARKRFDNSND